MIRFILRPVVRHIKLAVLNAKWRKNNQHNHTVANSIFTIEKVTVGRNTYGLLDITDYENKSEKLIIGNYCCIAENVKFILGGEHHPEFVSNYPFKMYLPVFDAYEDRKSSGPIIIGDDVWIGYGCIILSGVTIGQGAVIAAGSIVAKNVPPYAIYTTNRIIRYRFPQVIIDKLLDIDYSILDLENVKEHIDLFYTSNINELLLNPEWERFAKELEEKKVENKV